MNKSQLFIKTWKMYRVAASLRCQTKFDPILFGKLLKASHIVAARYIRSPSYSKLKIIMQSDMEKLVDEYSDVIKYSRF